MERKVIFLDIDGTLCRPGEFPSARTVAAIRQARRQGHKVLIATGRNLPSIPPVVLNIGFDGVIASAGGYVRLGRQVLLDRHMPPPLVNHARDVFSAHGIQYMLECDDSTYAEYPSYRELWAKGLQNDLRQQAMLHMLDGFSVQPLSHYCGQPVYKICFVGWGRDNVRQAVTQLGERFQTDLQEHPQSYMLNGETMEAGLDKGTAVQIICAHYGVSLKHAVAFGDSMNDVPMFLTAGVGIAMGNASNGVKRLADLVCGACDADGVYYALVQLGLTENSKIHG